MSNFSCWKPVDDGRIKPNIVGKGVGVYYLRFQINSENGYGWFLDDIKIENWGTVDIDDITTDEGVRIYASSGNIVIAVDENWNNVDILITNMSGQYQRCIYCQLKTEGFCSM